MKYLFVIQGEGRGHLTQAISLKQMLEKNGHEVCATLVGTSKKRKIPDFFYSKIGAEVIQFQSPNFMPVPKNKKSFILASIVYNLLLVPNYIKSIFTLKKTIKDRKPDIVINFYELLCGITYGILNLNAPMVNMAHQYYFLSSKFKYTGKHRIQFFLLNFYSKLTSLNSSKILALSFRKEESEQYEDISIIPPLLRQEILNTVPIKGNYIHGYLLNDGYVNELEKWSLKNKNEKLHFFWDRKNVDKKLKLTESLTLHSLDDVKFINYMAGAKAYATTAGFESVCEAIYFQKPILMVPTHIEQECNAIDALKSNTGVMANKFELDNLINFIPQHKINQEFRYWVNAAENITLTELTDFEKDTGNIMVAI